MSKKTDKKENTGWNLRPWQPLTKAEMMPLLDYYDYKPSPHKPLRRFLEIDGWDYAKIGESQYIPDEGGFYTSRGDIGHGLRKADCDVRVQVLDGTDKELAIKILRKIISKLQKDWERMTSEPKHDDNQEIDLDPSIPF